MSRRARSRAWTLEVAALVLLSWAGSTPLSGQEIRVTGITTLRYIQLRPMVPDSLPVERTLGDGILRRSDDGTLVRCVTGAPFCRFFRAGGTEGTVPAVQDLYVSAWGLGRGVRAYAHVRGRAALDGDDALWPRSDDAFDALEAYLELSRPRYRLRGGRLWQSSGLGYYNYDGASLQVRPASSLTLRAFGGWSLARGLSEPRTSDALEAIESFAPDDRGLLVGGEVRYRPSARAAASALYQREVRNDREGLYSERVAASGLYRAGRIRAEGTMEADLATRSLNEARLHLRGALDGGLTVEAWGRHYRPFFELWTIWGAFTPVAFDEVGVGGAWRPMERSLLVTARTSRRWYGETDAGFGPAPFRDDGWRLSLAASGEAAEGWEVQGGVMADVGFGAAKSQERIRVARRLGEDRHLGASLVAFQTLLEFRVEEGTVWGAVLDGGIRVSPRARAGGSLGAWFHGGNGSQSDAVDWSQLRGSLRLEWTVGPEPRSGMAGGRER